MKCILVASFLVIAVGAALKVPRDTTKYSTKYDNINVDEILSSERLLNNYVNCLMERGTCSPEGSELKRLLPEALENCCLKCTERQKENSEKVIRYFIEKREEIWKELSAKYDPEGKYQKRFDNDDFHVDKC